MRIRTAAAEDLSALAEMESICFPPEEAASHQSLARRLAVYPNHFWLMEDESGTLISFIDGPVTTAPKLSDEMFGHPELHDETGGWQMILGVNTAPEHRRRGYAAAVMERVIADAKCQGRKGCVLTCKTELVHYYEKFGYCNEGISASVHGGAVWYDMRLTF